MQIIGEFDLVRDINEMRQSYFISASQISKKILHIFRNYHHDMITNEGNHDFKGYHENY